MSLDRDAATSAGPGFELADGAPAAWSWNEYEAWLSAAWPEFLKDADSDDEEIFQHFLERHPCLVPGGEGTGDSFGGHHGGWRNLLISQPQLPGVFRRHPDFMWLTKNSEDIIPVLIEIEAPSKRWLTARGDRSADLTHAEGQLADWKQMLDDPASRQQFADVYGFPQRWAMDFNLVPRFILIYGRRSEFDRHPHLNRKRRGVRDMAIGAMTFDRLHPRPGLHDAVCVRIENLTPRVLAVPPTFRLGPGNAEMVARLQGLSDAIQSNELISEARRNFLLERIPYWTELGEASLGGQSLGIRRPSDWE